eukprot:5583631-Karenia_brevis.AAC.1
MGANSVASTKQGRCPMTVIAVTKGISQDLRIMGPTNTIMHMIEIINTWEGDFGQQWIRPQWDLMHAPPPNGQ